MPIALNMLRDALHYRKEAFNSGLATCGYRVLSSSAPHKPGPGDVLVIWNRYGGFDEQAKVWERAGARVLVVENGFLGKSWGGGNWFSLCLGHAGGAGKWPVKGAVRWESFGVALDPWKPSNGEILILGQRSIGEAGVRSPFGWAEHTRARIGVGRVRVHPGAVAPACSLERDLDGVSEVVTWNSSAAVIALLHGHAVWYDSPTWVMRGACRSLEEWGKVDALRDDDARALAFHRMAWGMWGLDEVKSGQALAHILGEGEAQ